MITFRKMIPLLIVLACVGCGDEKPEEETTYTLTVNEGSGSGSYIPGSRVTVEAKEAPAGKEFDIWSGDTDQVMDKESPVTTVTMPPKNISMTAMYRDIELGDPISLTLDPTVTYQTIDGFGFFGAYDVWWSTADKMWNAGWGEKVITDLGITIWRNEYFPPSIPGANQDADWNKQKPVVEGLKSIADQHEVNLKFLFTVWSPPADLKWESSFTWPGDPNATRNAGDVSTKNGGTLNPNKYVEYADWLTEGIKMYEDVGIDLFAISLQNEPMFTQEFNSCTYTFTWYNDLLTNVVPKIKTDYPDVKIFGSEHMLDMEGADNNWPYFYHSNIKANASASAQVDILAVHGYQDGVAPSSGSGLAERWTNHREQFATPMNKRTWMTETSGYSDTWDDTNDVPGAFGLAQDIHSGLYYGNISAWVWWQGSQLDGIGEYNLMNGLTAGKKYYVSKHYYRYIRPGAARILITTSDDESIFATAYKNDLKSTVTVVAINSSDQDKLIYLDGNDIPASFEMYRTTAGTDNCKLIGTVEKGESKTFAIPAKSIITLQAGGDDL